MITPELINFIKSELAKGKLQEQIKTELATGGWSVSDLDEAFSFIFKIPAQPIQSTPIAQQIQPVQTGFVSSNGPVSVKPKSHSKILIFFIILLVILGSAFAGWYFYKPEIMKMIGRSSDGVTKEVKNETPNALPIQTHSIKIISPKDGEEIVTGSDIVIQYEILENISDNIMAIIMGPGAGGDSSELCMETIQNKIKGMYSLNCKISDKQIGPTKISLVEINQTDQSSDNKEVNLELIAPKNLKPVDILIENEFSSIVQSPAGYVVASIKYDDGSQREIPFVSLKYSLDDPTLIYFLYPKEKAYAQHFIGYRNGTTTLHLDYQGVKKDFPVNMEGSYPPGQVPVRIDIGEEEQKIIDSLKNPLEKCVINNEEYYFYPGSLYENKNELYSRTGSFIAQCDNVQLYNSNVKPSETNSSPICKEVSRAYELNNCYPIN